MTTDVPLDPDRRCCARPPSPASSSPAKPRGTPCFSRHSAFTRCRRCSSPRRRARSCSSRLHARWAAKVAPTTLIQILFAASGILFLCEWVVRFTAPAATAMLLFLHTSATGPLLTSGFWLIATERFDPRTAKRRFGQITGAGTVGGLLGALRLGASGRHARRPRHAARARRVPVPDGLALLAVCRRHAARRRTRTRATLLRLAPPTRSDLRVIAEAPHLRHLVALVLLGSTSAALLDYLFKAKAVEAIGTGDQLLRFFALYYAAISLLTFILQVVSSRVVLERFGLALTTSTPSIALLAGSIGGLVAPGFGSLVMARAGESIFRGSWFRAGYELFYTPIPAAEKRAVKSIVDVSVDRLGDAVGGGLVRLAVLCSRPPCSRPRFCGWRLASSTVAIFAASRLNHWYVRTLGTSLVLQAPDLGRADTEGQLTRRMLLKVRSATCSRPRLRRPTRSTMRGPCEPGNRERAIAVLSREEGLSAGLVSHAIPLLAGPLSDYARLRAAQGRRGAGRPAHRRAAGSQRQDYEVRRQLARVFSVVRLPARGGCACSWRSTIERFDVRFQARDRWPPFVDEESPRSHRSRSRSGRGPSGSRGRPARLGEPPAARLASSDESPLDEFVRDRAGQSLAHVFTLLSLVLPSQPLQIAFRSLHSENSRLRGTALEYLEGVLPADIRERLWPFLVRGAVRSPFPATRRGDRQPPPLQLLGHPSGRRRT